MLPSRGTVAIIGGGPAGASAALELARLGIDTVLFEQPDGQGDRVGECLAPSINPLLQQLELTELLRASGALPSYGNRSSWGGNGIPADHDFLRDPFGSGWHLDRPAFDRALLAAVETAGVPVHLQTRVTALERTGGNWRLTTTSPAGSRAFHADVLIDATGRRSLVARHLRIRRRTFDAQVAAVAFLTPHEQAAPLQDATTIIEAAPDGWWYAALLPDGRLTVSWFTDPELLVQHTAWRPANWWTRLHATKLIAPLVTAYGYQIPSHIHRHPAGSSLLTQPTGDGWIATGDAAAAYDPLSSHGIGSALAGGRSAARALAATLAGDPTAFLTYRDHLLAAYAHYLATRHTYYAAETRWPSAPFWLRRHHSPTNSPGATFAPLPSR